MKRPIIRVLVLFATGIVAALICFGLLESTASLDGGWDLGGAFAGFIATILVLNHVWSDEAQSATEMAKDMGAEIVYEEVVKVLDLRMAPPDKSPQVAPLSNFYLVDRTKDDRDFHMHFATTGDLMWKGSPTHPHIEWTRDGDEDPTDGGRFPKRYELRVILDDDPVGQPFPVLAEVAYTDAFHGESGDSLETHVDAATDRLTMIVLMPLGRRATRGDVTFHSEGRDKSPAMPPVRVLQDGALVFWSVSAPPERCRLVLAWSWERVTDTIAP